MKVCVVGGAGFIGSHFSELMNQRGHQLLIYDAITYAANTTHPLFKSIQGPLHQGDRFLIPGGELCVLDIGDNISYPMNDGTSAKSFVHRELHRDKPDIVVNFAAESHVDNSIRDAKLFINTNIVGTFNLLEASFQTGVKKFIQVSTDEVYGTTAHSSFSEEDMLQPRSPYAASKAAADHLVYSYGITHGLNVSITRSSNNYGPWQHIEKFLPHMIHNMLNGKLVPVYGDGTNVRDWLYVTDNCRAIESVMNHGKPGEIYNIGGDNEVRNIDLVKIVAQKLGLDPEDVYEFVEDRKGHDFRYSVSCKKLCSTIGWEREIGFEEGLKRTIQHFTKGLA